MSYILEALKKAEAERNRGAVPDLHAQATSLATPYEEAAPRPARLWPWLLAGTAVALVALLAWRVSGDAAPAAASAPAPAAALPAPTAAPLPATQARVPPAAAPASAPISEPVVTPLQEATTPPASPSPAASAAPPVEPRATKPKAAPPARKATPSPSAAPAAAAAADGTTTTPRKAAPAAGASPASRAPSLSELPDDVRRQVPPLSIGGAVYSSQPASRMVIVNGMVAREGDTVAAGMVLEQIGPKAAVFSVRGQRFELPY